ncbi:MULTISPECIES: DUF1858 domain-containing protein [Salipiger]|uniref:DUF1858 domain-containing protein n=1 Tax=Salipiger mangrovisoli TaxID=2865933 RepID=A0ABR9X6T2_9RHOB|nr:MULTISPECIES: DUF1858 domain-containing protein [Salipiger]MBE9639194.1 DUF1858 domain-containing protein [Salipiger mangrovisoli]NDW33777.1 DUF1858 domain-containing protein [Salipiger sp. PrR007]
MRRRPNIDDVDLTLADLFALWPEAARPFLDLGMLCPGCPIAPFHTIMDSCREYGLDEDTFRNAIVGQLGAGR